MNLVFLVHPVLVCKLLFYHWVHEGFSDELWCASAVIKIPFFTLYSYPIIKPWYVSAYVCMYVCMYAGEENIWTSSDMSDNEQAWVQPWR